MSRIVIRGGIAIGEDVDLLKARLDAAAAHLAATRAHQSDSAATLRGLRLRAPKPHLACEFHRVVPHQQFALLLGVCLQQHSQNSETPLAALCPSHATLWTHRRMVIPPRLVHHKVCDRLRDLHLHSSGSIAAQGARFCRAGMLAVVLRWPGGAALPQPSAGCRAAATTQRRSSRGATAWPSPGTAPSCHPPSALEAGQLPTAGRTCGQRHPAKATQKRAFLASMVDMYAAPLRSLLMLVTAKNSRSPRLPR